VGSHTLLTKHWGAGNKVEGRSLSSNESIKFRLGGGYWQRTGEQACRQRCVDINLRHSLSMQHMNSEVLAVLPLSQNFLISDRGDFLIIANRRSLTRKLSCKSFCFCSALSF
jgi:hypothetical protein